jgi:hypothetical protein
VDCAPWPLLVIPQHLSEPAACPNHPSAPALHQITPVSCLLLPTLGIYKELSLLIPRGSTSQATLSADAAPHTHPVHHLGRNKLPPPQGPSLAVRMPSPSHQPNPHLPPYDPCSLQLCPASALHRPLPLNRATAPYHACAHMASNYASIDRHGGFDS